MSTQTFNLKNNPLVNPPQQPFNALPFGLFKPDHVEPAVDWALERGRKDIAAIIDNKDEPTFENTIHALAFAGEDLDRVTQPFWEMTSSINTDEVQAVERAIMPKLVKFSMDVTLNTKLFERVKHVYDHADRNALNVEEKILLDKTYNRYVNEGALLKGKQREEYKELSEKLSELRTQYGNNLVNSRAALKVVIKAQDKHRLDGIPSDTIESYNRNAKEDDDPNVGADDYVILMTPPPMPVYEYAHDRSLREEVRKTEQKVGAEPPYDNTPIVHEILKAKHRVARLLGFKNHAEKTIRPDTRMAGSAETVMRFLENNAEAYLPAAKAFQDELDAFARERTGITKLEDWDTLYYIRLMRQAQIGFDPEEFRPYFSLENVKKGLFENASKILGITAQEAKGKYSVLHDDVTPYEIVNADDGNIRAVYYLDMYARKFKNGGAWMSDIRNAGLHNHTQKIPMVGNYLNAQKPSPGKPSLLTPDEVETLFHEFGHGGHGMMGKGTYPGLTGINVFWDYVELPSQINECWAFQPEVLKSYARHHETGEPMPDHLIEKLQRLKAFDARWQGLRQTQLAMLDMKFHTTPPSQIKDLKKFETRALKDLTITESSAPPKILIFAHTMAGGYAAGYYSYKWADALVADVFAQFERQGIYDQSLCQAFRETMIEPGGTVPPSDMHKNFMEAAGQGRRELDTSAMFRAEGIKPPTPKGP
ncbi:MAG: M3 family metallopeptidase [Rhodospirillales bacterium]|nr:M3 family metallopeptidase [Rhodospirillales bacterium]MCB9997195.1 M3 family metallopeptidase [Rhodospirillales bacterium]